MVSSILIATLFSNNVSAVIIDAEGETGRGLNDNIASAMDVGSVTGNTFFFDIDYADDSPLTATSDDDNGLDSEMWIFNGIGELIASNDDSDFFSSGNSNVGNDPGSDIYGDYDPFIGGLALNSGVYYVSLSYYSNNLLSSLASNFTSTDLFWSGERHTGATSGDEFEDNETCSDDPSDQCSGAYRLQIRNSFTDYAGQLTIDGWIGADTGGNDVDFYRFEVNSVAQSVPEPSTLAIFALGMIGLASRRFKKQS
jgi:hypothetical protein